MVRVPLLPDAAMLPAFTSSPVVTARRVLRPWPIAWSSSIVPWLVKPFAKVIWGSAFWTISRLIRAPGVVVSWPVN